MFFVSSTVDFFREYLTYFSSRNVLWSYKSALETSLIRLKCAREHPLIWLMCARKPGTTDQTVPDQSDHWSDECARRSLCARSALEAASDQSSSRPEWPLIRQIPDHCPDEFQTIAQMKVRSKFFPDHVIWAHGNMYALETRLISSHFVLATSTWVTFAPTNTIILHFNFGDNGNCVRV